MKTAISIPDKTFRQAERTAKRLKMTRSELYRRALEAFIEAQSQGDIIASYNAAFSETEKQREKRFRRAAVRRALLSVEWSP